MSETPMRVSLHVLVFFPLLAFSAGEDIPVEISRSPSMVGGSSWCFLVFPLAIVSQVE